VIIGHDDVIFEMKVVVICSGIGDNRQLAPVIIDKSVVVDVNISTASRTTVVENSLGWIPANAMNHRDFSVPAEINSPLVFVPGIMAFYPDIPVGLNDGSY
jgi:hypothetical protein